MDCLEGMRKIQDHSIDMILCDLPYGTTRRNKWDSVINFKSLWEQYKRIIKNNGCICLFSQMPFTVKLIMSNPEMFRYEYIWQKPLATGFLNAKKMPLKAHENICIFYKHLPTYNPQFTLGKPYKAMSGRASTNYDKVISNYPTICDGKRYPKDVILFKNETGFHPTQKPVSLVEYLIKTYTHKDEIVLDNCMGSGTTAVACINTQRQFIGYEIEKKYCDIASKRISNAILNNCTKLFK